MARPARRRHTQEEDVISIGALLPHACICGFRCCGGRGFTQSDDGDGPRAGVVNQSLRKLLFDGEDPLGRNITMNRASYRIVGVVADVRHFGLQGEAEAALYVPYARESDSWLHSRSMFLTFQSDGDPLALIPAVRSAIAQQDPSIPIADGLRSKKAPGCSAVPALAFPQGPTVRPPRSSIRPPCRRQCCRPGP